MIKFKYTFKEDLLNLLRQTIVNYTSDFAIGYMNEGDVNNLRHRSLYLMCEIIEPTLQGNAVIVKRNEGAKETNINLELLFNAVVEGKLKIEG